MKRPTRPAIAKAVRPYIITEEGRSYIRREDTRKAMDLIISEYSGVYSGI